MATASYISIPTASSALETPVVQPVRQRSERAVSAEAGDGRTCEDQHSTTTWRQPKASSLGFALTPPRKSVAFDFGDILQLVLLLAFAAAAVSLPGIMLMKLFSAAAQFSSLDIVRMMAGMP